VTPERRLDIALRAFPRRFRAEKAEELRSAVADAADAGDAGAYGLRAMVDVVRAGWAERRRTRPPFGAYLRYRNGGRLAPRWHPWMLDDLQGWYPLRRAVVAAASYLTMMTVVLGVAAGRPVLGVRWLVIVGVVSVVASSLLELLGSPARNRTLRLHRYDTRTRRPLPPGDWWLIEPSWHARRAAPVIVAVGSTLAVLAPVAVVSLAIRSPLWLTSAAVGVALVVTGTTWGNRVRARWVSTHPGNAPGQRLVDHRSGRIPALSAAAAVAVGGLACAQAPVVAPAALLAAAGLAPELLALGRAIRRTERTNGTTFWLRRRRSVDFAQHPIHDQPPPPRLGTA
jgi:hypothetical protein